MVLSRLSVRKPCWCNEAFNASTVTQILLYPHKDNNREVVRFRKYSLKQYNIYYCTK